MQISGYRTIFMYILIISISFVAIACIQADSPLSNSNVNSVAVLMDSGHVYVPVENQAIAPIEVRSDVLVEKPAAATLSGTINENDFVVLEGIITLDGQNETVKLSGNATHGIVGWSVSEGEAYAATTATVMINTATTRAIILDLVFLFILITLLRIDFIDLYLIYILIDAGRVTFKLNCAFLSTYRSIRRY